MALTFKFTNVKHNVAAPKNGGGLVYHTTFKYYLAGDCACGAKKTKMIGPARPTEAQMHDHVVAIENKRAAF